MIVIQSSVTQQHTVLQLSNILSVFSLSVVEKPSDDRRTVRTRRSSSPWLQRQRRAEEDTGDAENPEKHTHTHTAILKVILLKQEVMTLIG